MSKDTGTDLSRRDTLRLLAWLPVQALGLSALSASSLAPRASADILTHCAAGIVACEHLGKGKHDDISLAQTAISWYLPTLKKIVKEDATHRQDAARLTARALLLKALLAIHKEGAKQAIRYAEQALPYSKESGDVALHLVLVKMLAWMHFCDRNYHKALERATEVKRLLEKTKQPVHPFLQSAIYATSARYQALCHRETDAFSDLKIAHNVFFAESGSNEYKYLYCDLSTLITHDGLTHYFAGQNGKALDSFQQVIDLETLETKMPVESERTRVEIITHATFAMLKRPEKDMQQVIKLWQAGVQGAEELQSSQRLTEVHMAYEMMQAVWPNEQPIKMLRGLLDKPKTH